MQLNHQQLAIADFALQNNNSLIVEALAGTGKTTMLMEILSCLQGTTFVCAFGNKAVGELRTRAAERCLVGDHIAIKTTNSVGMSTWMRVNRGRTISVEPNKIRLLLDDIVQLQPLAAKFSTFLCKLVAHGKRAGLGVLGSVNNDTNWLRLVEHFNLENDLQGENDRLSELLEIAKFVYEKSLLDCRTTIDFDDQILAPLFYDSRFIKYDNVLLDEAQDTSPLRLDLILRLCKRGGRFVAVGDRNQAIMQFTGASNSSMDEIRAMTDAHSLPLTITYRVPKSGVRLAQRWVPEFEAADTNIEGEVLTVEVMPQREVIDISSLEDTSPKYLDITANGFWDCGPFTPSDAILCRTTRPLVELAYQMIRRKIPCWVEGRDIGEGILRLAHRFKTASLADIDTKVRTYKRTEMDRLLKLYQDSKAESIGDQCDTLVVLIGLAMETGGHMMGDLVQLVRSIFGDVPEGEKPKCCTLSTVHKAKGREWDRVFVLGLYQYMPSRYAKKDWEVASERNLQFVAVTRHKQTLVIVTMPESGASNGSKEDGNTRWVTSGSNSAKQRSVSSAPRLG